MMIECQYTIDTCLINARPCTVEDTISFLRPTPRKVMTQTVTEQHVIITITPHVKSSIRTRTTTMIPYIPTNTTWHLVSKSNPSMSVAMFQVEDHVCNTSIKRSENTHCNIA